jgi:hypothetical protein
MVTIYEDEHEQRGEESTEEEIQIQAKSESETPYNHNSAFSPYMEKFLRSFEKIYADEKPSGGATMKVSEVLGGLARLYERIRSVVEYKGEHVLRRNAIERILKRRVWEQGNIKESVNETKIAESLIRELIWARYLPNNMVPRSKIESVARVVEKYIYFIKNIDSVTSAASTTKIRSWIWGIASSEIEDVLDPSHRDIYVRLMFDWFTDKFSWTDKELSDHEKDIQILLAIHRAHAKSDDSIMRYHLLMQEVPNWQNADHETLRDFIINFNRYYEEIENHLNYHGRFSLYRRVQKHSAAFDIFREIANQEKVGLRRLLSNKKAFDDRVREVCGIKYSQIRKKVNTGIVRSIIYIFITKVVIAMSIEIPYEVFMYNDVRYLPLTINIIFPPLMMWIIGMSTKIPGLKNTEAIISRLTTVVYPISERSVQTFSVNNATRNRGLNAAFSFVYIILFIIVFGGISYLLTKYFEFSLFGLVVFFFFLSLVTLFAFRVRYNAVQLRVDSESESFFGHFTSYLTLPFLNFGFYLSRGLAKINFLSVILDFIIEAPLKSIIEVFEEWTSFIREKKEEVVELPES